MSKFKKRKRYDKEEDKIEIPLKLSTKKKPIVLSPTPPPVDTNTPMVDTQTPKVDIQTPSKSKDIPYIQTTIIVDYNRAVCKDFKETGYCGYGDNCIYLHDRSDSYLVKGGKSKGWKDKEEVVKPTEPPPDPDCKLCKRAMSGKVAVLSCSHRFCKACFDRYWKQHSLCPHCSAPIDTVRYCHFEF